VENCSWGKGLECVNLNAGITTNVTIWNKSLIICCVHFLEKNKIVLVRERSHVFAKAGRKVETWCLSARMSVFRNAKKIVKGALPDEEEDSDDALSEEEDSEQEEQLEGDSDEEDGSGSDEEDDGDERGGKMQKTGEEAVRAGMKWVKPGRAGGGNSDDDSDDEEEEEDKEEEEEDADREISFPAQCSLCSKTFFNMPQIVEHMTSKGHLNKQRVYDQGQKKFFRSPAQVAKLKERNQRKKEKKLAKKKAEQAARGHVWGEHKKPPKSAEQRAADEAAAKAAAMANKTPMMKEKDNRTRAEKRASKKSKEERETTKGHVGGGGRGRPGDKNDWDSLPKQQGKRKNREKA
jgi:hypothetical protein